MATRIVFEEQLVGARSQWWVLGERADGTFAVASGPFESVAKAQAAMGISGLLCETCGPRRVPAVVALVGDSMVIALGACAAHAEHRTDAECEPYLIPSEAYGEPILECSVCAVARIGCEVCLGQGFHKPGCAAVAQLERS